MLDKETGRFAGMAPKGKAAAAPRPAKKTATTPAIRTGTGKSAATRGRKDDVYERVQRRAYELWESEGRPAGREHAHWLQAESEIARARGQRIGMGR